MVTGGPDRSGMAPGPAASGLRQPPVDKLGVAALILVIAGGIWLAAHLPQPPPLGPAIGALAAAGVVLAAALLALSRVHDFAWRTFAVVAGWSLAAYLVIAGMLEYVFALDHTPGTLLVILTLMLVIFAVDVPLLLAFSVARYQRRPSATTR